MSRATCRGELLSLAVNPILDTRISVRLFFVRNAQTTPLDSETGGLESSGQKLISLNGKTKKKHIFVVCIFFFEV